MTTFGRFDQPPPDTGGWQPMPEQQHQRGGGPSPEGMGDNTGAGGESRSRSRADTRSTPGTPVGKRGGRTHAQTRTREHTAASGRQAREGKSRLAATPLGRDLAAQREDVAAVRAQEVADRQQAVADRSKQMGWIGAGLGVLGAIATGGLGSIPAVAQAFSFGAAGMKTGQRAAGLTDALGLDFGGTRQAGPAATAAARTAPTPSAARGEGGERPTATTGAPGGASPQPAAAATNPLAAIPGGTTAQPWQPQPVAADLRFLTQVNADIQRARTAGRQRAMV